MAVKTEAQLAQKLKNTIRLERAAFSLDDIVVIVKGFHIPSERWNGWACPAFEKHEAEKIVEAWQAQGSFYTAGYNAETDTFWFDCLEGKDEFQGLDFAPYHVYPIGSHCWCWIEEA